MLKRLIIFGLILHWSLAIGHWSFAGTVELLRVEAKRDRGYDYLDVYTSGFSEAKGLLLEDKLYVDFPGAKISPKFKIIKIKSKRIKGIEVSGSRVVVALKKKIDYDIVNVFGRDKSVIEIGDRQDGLFAFQAAWEEKDLKKKTAPLKPVKLAPVVSEKKLSLRGKTIVLDPGHGGDDPGAFSNSGVPEKILTLQTARTTAKLLRAAGATVYLTRDEDRRSNLKDVVEFTNKTDADIFISIHYNSTRDPKVSGTETYYHNPISRDFAEKMHEAVIRGIKRRDRGLHRVRFYTVKNSSMPSVLLEPVYLSNAEENNLAGAAAFQAELAEDVVKGVKEYFRSRTR